MSWIQAQYFDGHSSRPRDCEIEIGLDGLVRVQGLDAALEHPLTDVEVSPRVGATPRIVQLPDGACCEVTDNDAIDEALAANGALTLESEVQGLESRWSTVTISVAALVAVVWAAIEFGVPALAGHVATAMPAATDEAIGHEALGALDRLVFKRSKLPESRQDELREFFKVVTGGIDDGHQFRLELRAGGEVGANAFALPSGIVVLTDELVTLAEDDAELLAVMAHEAGHVVNRHSLRMLLQNSATSLLIIAVLGDLSSATTLVAGVPTFLVQMKHSRAFEREADDFAYLWLDRHGVPRRHLATLLKRLEQRYGGNTGNAVNWLSSHPRTAERLRD